MTPSEIERLQTYLRKLFGSERIKIVPPPRRGLSIELAVNDETIGTVHKDVDDGETSYSIHSDGAGGGSACTSSGCPPSRATGSPEQAVGHRCLWLAAPRTVLGMPTAQRQLDLTPVSSAGGKEDRRWCSVDMRHGAGFQARLGRTGRGSDTAYACLTVAAEAPARA